MDAPLPCLFCYFYYLDRVEFATNLLLVLEEFIRGDIHFRNTICTHSSLFVFAATDVN